jgi:hypothetical protein
VRGSLYRYLSERYVKSFIAGGEIWFRSLSYFRDFEDELVRGDEFEGTRVHLPADGLKLTMMATGEEVLVPYSFESTAREDDIFVYCLSTVLSKSLAAEFKTSVCVEIFKPSAFEGLVQRALDRRPSIKNKRLYSQPIAYYDRSDPPIVDWALPERIALSKPAYFSHQSEHRLAFAVNGAFDVQNVSVRLAPLGNRRPVRSMLHPHRTLNIGNLSKLCKVHRF